MSLPELSDLTTDDQTGITALHVIEVAANPLRFYGQLGNNMIGIPAAADFVDAIVPGDIVQVGQNEDGNYEATSKLGHRLNPDTEYLKYQLPWDFQQLGWDGGTGSLFYTGAQPLPPAMVYANGQNSTEARYGNLDTVTVASVAYWGHSTRFAFPGLDAEPAQRLSLVPISPNPGPLTLVLQSAKYPGDPVSNLATEVTVTPIYQGPDIAQVVDLPTDWIAAFAAGTAGSIRFEPSDSTPGITRLFAGRAGSLSLHR